MLLVFALFSLTQSAAVCSFSIDVDKFDYLMRDAKNCNVRVSVDLDRIMK